MVSVCAPHMPMAVNSMRGRAVTHGNHRYRVSGSRDERSRSRLVKCTLDVVIGRVLSLDVKLQIAPSTQQQMSNLLSFRAFTTSLERFCTMHLDRRVCT
jgi:hypothetical protein